METGLIFVSGLFVPCARSHTPTAEYLNSSDEETQVEEFNLLSPATGPGNAARTSIPDDGWLGSAGALTGNAAEDSKDQQHQHKQQQREDGEISRLKKEVEKLEQANIALTEKLVEARLEATALRRSSTKYGEAMLAWTTRSRRCSSWSNPDDCGNMGPWPIDADEAGVRHDGAKEARNQRLDRVFGGADSQEFVQENREMYSGDGSLPREEKVHVDHTPVAPAPADNKEETTSSRGGERKWLTPAATAATAATAAPATPASSHRRLSSSASKDAEEQAELVEALRGQIAQLRLEVQTARKVAHSSSAQGEDAEGGQASRRSNCSSDDSGEESGGDNGDRATGQESFEESAFGKGGDGPRRQTGGDNLDGGNGFGRAGDDPAKSLLRARVCELSAELKAANGALGALREQAQQNQATTLELQRELLRLRGERDKSSVVAAAVARVSAGTAVRPAAYITRRDPGGDGSGGGGGGGGENQERRSDCLNYGGLGWLHRLWRTIFCGGDRYDAMGDEMDSTYDEAKMAGSCGIGGKREHDVGADRLERRRERTIRRFSSNEQECRTARRILGR